MAVGVEGIFMETHDDPRHALSDGPNVVPTTELAALLRDLKALHRALGRPAPPAARGY
jgi:2-dehydro-3-deoxyphosphooctonate aldolase (KDO 8-P synthase)